MRREIRRRKKKSGAPKWMVTYSDMVTLILVFFILLFSMSQIDLVKFEAVSESFRNRMIFDFEPSAVPLDNPSDQSNHHESGKLNNEFERPSLIDEEEHENREESLANLMEEVEEFLDENELNDVISASRTDRGVILVLQDSILFEPGEAEVLSTALPFLTKVGQLLTSISNYVKVEGHTDSVPMSSYRYPSNWELSGARASSVVRFLIDESNLEENRFSIAGFGETRPIVPNDSDQNRSMNRRVEIIILDESTEESKIADQ